jgi:transcriptional regulator with XRE-family HTH domain
VDQSVIRGGGLESDICVRVGRRIRSLGLKRGWTQQMLADHAQLTREHVSAVETGKAGPGLRTLERIALALEIALPELIRN